MSSAKGTKSDSGAKKRLRKKRTLALIKSLDGSLYKHFTTTPDPPPPPSGPSTSPTATSTNPSRESFEDVHACAVDQSSSVCSGGLRRADFGDADMESDRDRDDSNVDIIDNEDYGARAETADATKFMSSSNLSSFEECRHHQHHPHQVGLDTN